MHRNGKSHTFSLARLGAWVESMQFKRSAGQDWTTDSREAARIAEELRAKGVPQAAIDREYDEATRRGQARAARIAPATDKWRNPSDPRRDEYLSLVASSARQVVRERQRSAGASYHGDNERSLETALGMADGMGYGKEARALARSILREAPATRLAPGVAHVRSKARKHRAATGDRNWPVRNGRRVWHVEFHPAVGQTTRLKQVVERWSGKLNTSTFVATFAAADDAENATNQAADWGIAGRDTRRAKPVEGRARRNPVKVAGWHHMALGSSRPKEHEGEHKIMYDLGMVTVSYAGRAVVSPSSGYRYALWQHPWKKVEEGEAPTLKAAKKAGMAAARARGWRTYRGDE